MSPEAPKERRETVAACGMSISSSSATATSTSVQPTIFVDGWGRISADTLLLHADICLLRSYVAVEDEATARRLERYFKSGSGKAFAKKRLLIHAPSVQ